MMAKKTPRASKSRETKIEEVARIFPHATSIIRARLDSGEVRPTNADAISLADAWKLPEHKFEAISSAHTILVMKLPVIKTREGRAKWEDYDQLSLWGDAWKEIGCRTYVVPMADGKFEHLCAFQMIHQQRMYVISQCKARAKADNAAARDMNKLDKRFTAHGCPLDVAPSDFFQKQAPLAAAA